jgi:hypothetical protein
MSLIQTTFDEMICKGKESVQESAIKDFKDKVQVNLKLTHRSTFNFIYFHY